MTGPHTSLPMLRKHQAEALELVDRIGTFDPAIVGRKFFTAYVTPGGGKTIAARLFAQRMMALGLVKKVIYLTPNDVLRTQSKKAFSSTKNGWPDPISLIAATNENLRQHRTATQTTMLVEKPRGFVATYQQVAAADTVGERFFAELATASDYLLILDEFHHLSEAEHAAWRIAVAPIVEAAKYVLAMTGTLHRTDEERIPWARVTEDGNSYDPDIYYGRREALADGAILPVKFSMIDGEAVIPYKHGERATLLSESTAKEAAKALLTALNDKAYSHAMAVKCLRDWMHYRDTKNPQAKALVICHDTAAADALGATLGRELGVTVVVAHSKTSSPTEAIQAFQDGAGDVLVSVGMTSEGFDCPAISHLVYLSNVIAPVSVAQAWARPLRPNHRCEHALSQQLAYIAFPMHPVLVQFAENWMEEQIGYFREFEREAGKPRQNTGRGRGRGPSGSCEIGDEYVGDADGRLEDEDQRIYDGATKINAALRHLPPREVVAMARSIAALVGAR